MAQGGVESGADHRWNLLLAFGLAGFVAAWIELKTRAFPTWRGIRDTAAGAAILALASGAFLWRYEARTRSIATRAEARWTEIGLPMAEFEKTLASSTENAGSEVVRQVLHDRVSSRFYRDGTRAAEREPAIQTSSATMELIKRVRVINSAALPASDDLALSSKLVALIEPLASALDADYRRILAAEPSIWASDPRDGYFISVPNFPGVRMFSELIAADATRRFSAGDEEGATRALAAGERLREGLRQNPAFLSLMIDVALEALLASKQVRLPASANGLQSVAREAASLRSEFIRRLRMEGWINLQHAGSVTTDQGPDWTRANFLPKWAGRIVNPPLLRRAWAIAALNGTEHAAIHKSPATLMLPDLGASLHEAVYAANPSVMDGDAVRAAMRIYASLLLREQTELIRDTRTRLAVGRPVESRDSVVLPGARWELAVGAGKDSVATRLIGAPEWIVKNQGTSPAFWVLPLDGSVEWKFRLPAQTVAR